MAAVAELVAGVEGGETDVVTRDGRPVLDLVPNEPRGMDPAAGGAFVRARGIGDPFARAADDPPPEDHPPAASERCRRLGCGEDLLIGAAAGGRGYFAAVLGEQP